MQQARSRPKGVSIIAILNIISGIVMLIGGVGLVTVGTLLPTLPSSVLDEMQQNTGGGGLQDLPPALLGGVILSIGAIILALGVASFVVAYGLWKGLGWAWTVTVVLAIISLVLNAITVATGNPGGIISIIISAVILYYMYRRHVKEYFGKAVRHPSPS